MNKLCELKDILIDIVEEQLDGDIKNIDAVELGEVVDMIKDMAQAYKYCKEAEYYININDAMESSTQSEKEHYINKYIPEINNSSYMSRMYYSNNNGEGKSSTSRKMYMNIKDSADNETKSKELEKYMNDLSEDVTELIIGMENTNKQMIKQKLINIANKIV